MLKHKTGLALPNPEPTKPIVQVWALRIITRFMPPAEWLGNRGFVSSRLADLLALDLAGLNADAPDALCQLRSQLTHKLAELEARLPHTSPTEQFCCEGLQPLVNALGLNRVEAEVLDLACAMCIEVPLREVVIRLDELNRAMVYQLVARALDHPLPAVKAALSKQGSLARSGVLVLRARDSMRGDRLFELLNSDLPHILAEPDTQLHDVLRSVVHESAPGSLTLLDYPHLQARVQHLLQYLRTASAALQPGVNVLLYGPPGTGKTELARTLAREMGQRLYEVSGMNAEGEPTSGAVRMKSLMLAQACLSNGANLLLFDEVEDVLQPRDAWFDTHRTNLHKAWLHRLLETNGVPTVWVTNSVAHMDPAMVRRFDVVLEVPVPPRAQREKILLAHASAPLDAALLAALADHEALSPAIVARAARVTAGGHPDADASARSSTLLALVNQTLKAQGLPHVANPTALDMRERYSMTYLNPDQALAPLVQALAEVPAGRFCLYGPPGTGKTAFARWVAQQLGRPLLVRRASDLLSAWVGGNERNIAAAFAQAQADGAVLLIDEVDSFLQPRESATRGWEASMVNEMLTQMEGFQGILFATTNLFKGLDAAAMRRFDLKVHFRPPTAQQLQALLQRTAEQLGIGAPTLVACEGLARWAITPGDVAAVVRLNRFARLASVADLVQALEAEGRCKPGRTEAPMGFV